MDKISIRGAAILRADDSSRVISFRASTTAIDRHGTRLDILGVDTANYETNAIFGWAHDLYGGFFSAPQINHVLGRTVAIRKSPQSLDIDVEFAPPEINPTADMALRMVRGKFLNAVSVGFIPLSVVVDMDNGVEIPRITKSELLEVSLVSIPSNPEALALTRDWKELLTTHRTPPAEPADFGAVIDALTSAFSDWQLRKAFERSR